MAVVKLAARRTKRIIAERVEYQLLSMTGRVIFASDSPDIIRRVHDTRAAQGTQTRMVEAVTIIKEMV
jgi:hypothetical protein